MINRARLPRITVLIALFLVTLCIIAALIFVLGYSDIIILLLIITAIITFLGIGFFIFNLKHPKKSKAQEILYRKFKPSEGSAIKNCPMCGVKLPKNSKRGTVCGFCGKVIN